MTLDDLRDQVNHTFFLVSKQRFDMGVPFQAKKEDHIKLSTLMAELSFKEQTLEVAERFGIDAAMLFKLSDGAIDPRF